MSTKYITHGINIFLCFEELKQKAGKKTVEYSNGTTRESISKNLYLYKVLEGTQNTNTAFHIYEGSDCVFDTLEEAKTSLIEKLNQSIEKVKESKLEILTTDKQETNVQEI